MPLFLPSSNIYQQKRSGQDKNLSEQNITTYLLLSSHQTNIINFPQKKKTMNHPQEHSQFILLKITPFPHINHNNHMSKLLYT